MSIELTLLDGRLVELKEGLPETYSGPVLKGASASWSKTNLAQYIVQELQYDYYSIRYYTGKFLQRLSAAGNIYKEGLYTFFMLQNSTRKEIKNIGKIHLREDQYACLYTEPVSFKVIVEANKQFTGIDLFYSPKLLEELLPFFPDLKEVLASPSLLLNGKVCWGLPSMNEIIHQLLNCPYDEATMQFYFDIKVRELLYQMLERSFKRKQNEYRFTPWEVSRIHEARTILESYIPIKPPTIRTLSKMVALNEGKLKKGFKQYFSVGLSEWLMDKKMQYAKELILTTNKPIKEIAKMVGYPLSTNFITAFRKKFGTTPGALRGN